MSWGDSSAKYDLICVAAALIRRVHTRDHKNLPRRAENPPQWSVPVGSLQPQLLQKWTKAKSRLALLPIVGTVRCLRSLHRPRHRPNGTGLSSGAIAAPLVAAPSTRAPDHLAPQHCAVCAKSAWDCGCDCAPMGHRHSVSHRGRTHGYVASAASES